MRANVFRNVTIAAATWLAMALASAAPVALDGAANSAVRDPALRAAGAVATRQDSTIAANGASTGLPRGGSLANAGGNRASERPAVLVATSVAAGPSLSQFVDDDATASPGMIVAGLLVVGLIAMRRLGG